MNSTFKKLEKVAKMLDECGKDDLSKKVRGLIPKLAAEELIAAEYAELEEVINGYDEANQEIAAAERIIEAAAKRKKKWTKGIDLKKGRLTEYKKPGESMEDAAKRALNSDDPSVRGMGSFYFATKRMRKQKKKGKAAGDTKAENRPQPVFESTNPKVKDDKDHFPINDEAHARNALARANQYDEAPSWYDGSLDELKKTVADAVKAKYPDIEVTEESYI